MQAVQVLAQTLGSVLSTVLQALAPIITMIGGVLAQLAPVIGNIIALIGQLIANALNLITPIIQNIANFIAQIMPLIQLYVMTVIDIISTTIQTVMPVIEAIVTTVMTAIGDIIRIVTALIQGDWEGVWNGIVAFFGNIWNNIGNIVQTGINAVVNLIGELPGKILGFFSDAGTLLFEAGKSILQGFLDGLLSIWNNVTDFIGGIADYIVEHKGPLEKDRKLLIPAGKAIMQSLGTGLNQGLSLYVKPELADITDEMANARLNTNLMLETAKNRGNFGVTNVVNNEYNAFVDNARVNDNEAMRENFVGLLMELERLWKMEGASVYGNA